MCQTAKTAGPVETSEENQEDSIVTNSETLGTEDTDTSSTDDFYESKPWMVGFYHPKFFWHEIEIIIKK